MPVPSQARPPSGPWNGPATLSKFQLILSLLSEAEQPRGVARDDALVILGREVQRLQQRRRAIDIHEGIIVRADHDAIDADPVDQKTQGLRVVSDSVVVE